MQVRQLRHIAQGRRNAAAESVLIEGQRFQLGELCDLGWDAPREPVSVQVQPLQLGQVLHLGGNGPGQAGPPVDVLVPVEAERTEFGESPYLGRYVTSQVVPAQIQVLQRIFEFPELRRDPGFVGDVREVVVVGSTREVVIRELQLYEIWEVAELRRDLAADLLVMDRDFDQPREAPESGRKSPVVRCSAIVRFQDELRHALLRRVTDSADGDAVPCRDRPGSAPVEPPPGPIALEGLLHAPEDLAVLDEFGVVGVVCDDRPVLAEVRVIRDGLVGEGRGVVAAPVHDRVGARWRVAHQHRVARRDG